MRRQVIFVDEFSVGLEQLSRKDAASQSKVLGILKRAGRLSAFEASDNDTIARTVTNLFREKLIEDVGGDYPWTEVCLTEAGEAVLKSAR